MRLLLALTLALSAACRKPAPPPSGPVEFSAADGSFRARVPGDWKVDDARDESRKASFFGPPSGPTPFSDLMGVYYHAAENPVAAARAYVASQTGNGPGLAPPLGGDADALDKTYTRDSTAPHSGTAASVSTRVVAVVVPGGFYSLEHTWPAAQPPAPAFDDLLKSFSLGAPTK